MSVNNRKISDPETFRNNVRNKLSDILHSVTSANNLEKGIYNNSLEIADKKNVVTKFL